MILIDTSVWIELFREQSPYRVEARLELDEVVTCLPVVQEVLQGFRDERAYSIAREAMLALPIVESPLGVEVFEEAVALFRRARGSGLTIRSGVDCLIAACALRSHVEVLHHDRDFDSLARVSTLQVRRLAGPLP
ncbi:MAG: PIN domain-containing protein [Thermoanaerobaculia bacterium]|nr:PIN domain-containing protein [Thermoanaerobaculia bacterium]